MTAIAESGEISWKGLKALMVRPQPVTAPMVLLFAILPFYLVIGAYVANGPAHVPELALDRALPLVPAWSLVYWSLFLAAVLPVFVVHQPDHVHRTILAFVFVWLAAFICFLSYPTVASRPTKWPGAGFGDWGLRLILSTDIRHNCLPSLHVAQCFLAAFTCGIVHRGVGAVAIAWASLVAISTLLTKQHYVLDVIGGLALAIAAYALFLRGFPRDAIPQRERRYAPLLGAAAAGVYAAVLLIFSVLYAAGIDP